MIYRSDNGAQQALHPAGGASVPRVDGGLGPVDG